MYVWADGIDVKAGLHEHKAARLVVITALRDEGKVVLAVDSGYLESTESWEALLRVSRPTGLRTLHW